MSNHHTHSIEDYQFNHGFHRVVSSGKYVALHPHYLGRPLTHEEMDFNLLYAEQTLAGFRIFGSNSDLSLSDDDLGKSLLFHKIASSDSDFARYTSAGYTEGQYIWIPDCCGTQVDCSTFQVVSISAIDSGGQDDCISFTVDNIVATDSDGSENVVTPTPTATQNVTPTPTATQNVTPTPTATAEVTQASIGNLWISNSARDEHYEYSIPANNASSFIQTNQINIDAYDSHVAYANNVIGFASSINNAIMIYRRSGTQWNYEASVPCFVNDDNTLSISMNKNHFDFSDDGNTLVCISNVGAGDDITEYGGGSQTEGRIYRYQPTSGAWILSGVIPRLSNHTGMRYASISADGDTVSFSEFAASNDPGLSTDFPRRRTGIWNWGGTQWVPKMNPAGYEQGYRTYLNSDGSKMLTTAFDPSNYLSDAPTGVKIMYWDSSAGVIGAWVDEFTIPNSTSILQPRMFSPSGNEFVIGDGNTEYVYAWDGSTWNLKGTITTGAISGQYSYESDNNADILTVQEWTVYQQDGTTGVWEYDGNNYVQLTPELTHAGFSHSSALTVVSTPITPTPTPTSEPVVTPTPTAASAPPAITPTPTTTQAVNSITLAYNYSLGMGSLSFSGMTASELGDATCNALAANYQTQTYYGTLGIGTQFTNANNGDSNQYWVTNQYYGTNQGPLWVVESTEYIIETDVNGVVVRYEPFVVQCLPTATPTPTATSGTSNLIFNYSLDNLSTALALGTPLYQVERPDGTPYEFWVWDETELEWNHGDYQASWTVSNPTYWGHEIFANPGRSLPGGLVADGYVWNGDELTFTVDGNEIIPDGTVQHNISIVTNVEPDGRLSILTKSHNINEDRTHNIVISGTPTYIEVNRLMFTDSGNTIFNAEIKWRDQVLATAEEDPWGIETSIVNGVGEARFLKNGFAPIETLTVYVDRGPNYYTGITGAWTSVDELGIRNNSPENISYTKTLESPTTIKVDVTYDPVAFIQAGRFVLDEDLSTNWGNNEPPSPTPTPTSPPDYSLRVNYTSNIGSFKTSADPTSQTRTSTQSESNQAGVILESEVYFHAGGRVSDLSLELNGNPYTSGEGAIEIFVHDEEQGIYRVFVAEQDPNIVYDLNIVTTLI